MAIVQSSIPIGDTGESLDSVEVTTSAGAGLHRETVVIADPETPDALVRVRQIFSQLTMTDWAVAVQAVIHGRTSQGNIVDIKANPSGALAVDATDSVVGLTQAVIDAIKPLATQPVSGTVTSNQGASPYAVTQSGAWTVAVNNFPATQAVSGTVNVGNFPATQAVSGTVTANLGALNGAATAANQTTGNNSLSSLDGKLPDESGAWGYNAGVSGTLTVAANKRVLQISATAPALSNATYSINGGQTITVPAGTTHGFSPRGNLVAPTITFTGTTAYTVEFVE